MCIVCSAAYSAGVYVIVIGVSLSMCTVYFLLCAVLEFVSPSLVSVYQRVQCTFFAVCSAGVCVTVTTTLV